MGCGWVGVRVRGRVEECEGIFPTSSPAPRSRTALVSLLRRLHFARLSHTVRAHSAGHTLCEREASVYLPFLRYLYRCRGARDIPRNPALVAGEERGCSLDPGTLHWCRGGEGVLG